MIKLLLFLLFITCVGFAASFLVENSGNVTMFWFDYRIDTSVAFLIFFTILVAILFAGLVQLFFAPARFFERRELRKLKRGISELTYSVAALAASDIASAQQHTHKVENLLGRTPLTLLLSAQIAKTKGDEPATNALLEQLILHKETNFLAARSLSDNANQHNNLPQALEFALQANNLNPKDILSSLQVINLQVRLKQWDRAEASLKNARFPRKERSRLRALINIIPGRELLENGYEEEALRLAKYTISQLPNFIPAAQFAANAYQENDKSYKAERILRKIPPNNVIWQCKICATSQKIWDLHCPHCHAFDALEEKTELFYGEAE
jgi:uncharacterized membrane-anchored protein